MKTLQILGTGCPKCKKLAEHTETAAKELGIDYDLVKVTEINAIMGFGVSDGLQGIYGNLAQSWNFSTESKRLSPESALIYSFIRCGNSFGMACKSMDFKQNSGFFEIF